mmetsp:Transcript_10724/g.18316  ORF Transcript_10724/g.18316 Transcript_10724/m.18316 type:complete len:442 (+) Transcript_10724:48-1373(+)
METMASKEEQQKKKKKTQQDLDSILDAALDELEDDSDDDNCDDYKEVTNALNQNVDDGSDPSQPMAAADAIESDGNAATMGVPYSLEYLANNPHGDNNKQTISEINNRPKFGPDPPPPPPPPSTDQGLSTEEANLAASLEGMMKQFASGLDSAGVDFNSADEAANMADLENAEKALEEMFKKMMMGDVGGGMSMPLTPPSSTGGAAAGSKSKKSSKSKSATVKNGKSSNNKESNEKNEPDVDESINRLLDGINQASTTPQQSNTNGPTMPPIPPNIDPSQLEHLSEQMMGSLMNDFEQLNTSKDSNDVVDGVMKQLLDKELMYEPMKEVCTRYPKWLATNKDRLSTEEYQKYGTQYQYFQRIVRLYETDPGNFDRLMELMQDIQEYGQPPVEIIKELAPELQFDEEGMPVMDPMGGGGMPGMMPGMPFPMGGPNGEQCCIS